MKFAVRSAAPNYSTSSALSHSIGIRIRRSAQPSVIAVGLSSRPTSIEEQSDNADTGMGKVKREVEDVTMNES